MIMFHRLRISTLNPSLFYSTDSNAPEEWRSFDDFFIITSKVPADDSWILAGTDDLAGIELQLENPSGRLNSCIVERRTVQAMVGVMVMVWW